MTKIEWTDETWNPLRGCTRVSPGCQNCYAERMSARGLPGLNSPTTGKPFATVTPSGPRWAGAVELIESQLEVPIRWRKPRRVFVNSMSDTFHESVPVSDLERIWRVVLKAAGRGHTMMILTKRARRMAELVPLQRNPRVWLGVSVEDNQRANERIRLLMDTPAAVRFLSVEPLLERVDLRPWLDYCVRCDKRGIIRDAYGKHARCWLNPGVNWVIVGGESGPGARPCDVEWVRSVVQQCKDAGVPCFVKQMGSNPGIRLHDSKGGDPSEWPEDLRVRQFPQ